MILQIPGEISKVETMRGGAIRIRFDSQEAIQPEVRSKLMMMTDQVGWISFASRQIQPEDIIDLPEVKRNEDMKSPAQRLRATIFILWKHEGSVGSFEDYYVNRMSKLIDFVKNKLT